MSHSGDSRQPPFLGLLLRLNQKLPFIILGLVFMMSLTTTAEYYHYHPPEAVHEHWHDVQHGIHLLLWFFFLVMGAEISLKGLMSSGKLVVGSTLGGMLVPFGLTATLLVLITDVPTYSVLPISYGAMATDVPISVSLGAMITGGAELLVLLLRDTLNPLAIGDDLGGVLIMTAAYLNNVQWMTIAWVLVLLSVCFIIGERGHISASLRLDKNEEKQHVDLYFHVDSTIFWLVLSALCTFLMIDVGAEAIIGGCLPMIFAPEKVKHEVIHLFEPILPIILFLFGLSVGGINLLDPTAWGSVTLATLVGGHVGKILGVSGAALFVRSRLPEGSLFKKMPTGQIMTLGMLAAVNGTVAIIFINAGANATAMVDGQTVHLISAEHAMQAKLGYFLTIFASLVEVMIINYLAPKVLRNWFFGESSDFQPSAAGDPLDEQSEPRLTA